MEMGQMDELQQIRHLLIEKHKSLELMDLLKLDTHSHDGKLEILHMKISRKLII
jgi:hypothetical protein